MSELEAKLRALMRGQYSSLTISFNDFSSSYCDARKAIDDGILEHVEWVSDDEKQKAIETNSVWIIQWYPDTPVGFYCTAASSLDAVLKEAFESENS